MEATQVPTLAESYTETPGAELQTRQRSQLQNMRKYLTGAIAAALVAAPATALAQDAKKDQNHVTAPKVARVSGVSVDDAQKKEKETPSKPHEDHLKHNTLKLGTIASIAKHPSLGTEVTWSYMPSTDERQKFHFVITPIDFFAAQHHLEYEGEGNTSGIKSHPKYFVGSLVGFSYLFNEHLEMELGAGGGVTFIPSSKPNDAGITYQAAPSFKVDAQLDYIINHHFGVFIGYSPEYVPTPIAHKITPEGIEKKPHLAHVVSLGLRTEF